MDKKEITMLLKKTKFMNTFMWFFIVFAGFCAYLFIILGEQRGDIFYSGLILLIPLGFTALYFRKRILKYKALYAIKTSWGKTVERKRKFDDIEKLHNFLKQEEDKEFFIDNQTCEDLSLHKVFEKLDMTLSVPGEQMLYHILRNPKFDSDILKRRKKIINLFQNTEAIREKFQLEFYLLGRQFKTTITDFLWGELPTKSKITILFNLLGFSPLVILALMPFLGLQLAIFLVFIFILNMITHFIFKDKINQHLDSINYLSSLLNTAKKLENIEDPLLKEYTKIFKTYGKHIKAAKNTGLLSSVEGIDFLSDYISIMFLSKERKFYAVLDELTKYRKELQGIYMALGELDALISIASYRINLDFYVEPELKREGKFLKADELIHPLIKNPIPNSISIENNGIVLTGSNMSGKSTFLRTVGINVLFAQTICTCLSKSYSGSYFKLLSSISPSDNLLVGKSYYLGEAEAVLRIIKSCEDDIPTFCIIDEIFRGTNPIERISASASILDYLIAHNCLPIVATHDLELTEMVYGYECYYFTEDVDADGLKFDYLLKKGVSQKRNAIKLLKYLGYPEEILKKTYDRVENLL